MTPLALVPDEPLSPHTERALAALQNPEPAEEHLGNALQLLRAWVYLGLEARAGTEGVDLITAAVVRIEKAQRLITGKDAA